MTIELPQSGSESGQKMSSVAATVKKLDALDAQRREIEAAIEALDLFGHHSTPRMTHTICDSCRGALRLKLHQEPGEELNSG